MNSELAFQTAFCNEYEDLLHECQDAKEICAQWRAEMNPPFQNAQFNREVSNELLRLQANYAKAYSRLEQHNRECELCQFVNQMSAHRRESSEGLERVAETWIA